MEKEIEPSNLILFHQQLSTVLGNKEKFKCIKGNAASHVCSDPKCLAAGLVCVIEDCQCKQAHFRCKQIFLSWVLKSVLNKSQNIPELIKQSYKIIYEKINKMIDDLSDLRNQFYQQEQYFGLMKQELKFIELVRQNKISEINGNIISQMENTLDSNVQFLIKSKEQIKKDFQDKSRVFDKLCNDIRNSYGKKDKKYFYGICEDSKIITTQQNRQLMKKWLCQQKQQRFDKICSKLLFRASENQFKTDKFKQMCSNIPDTLVIIINEYDKIIGGFTHQQWANNTANNYDQYVNDTSKQSFLFSINLKQKYKCKNHANSIRNYYGMGPMFGGGGDLYIYQNANTSGDSYANFPHSYNLECNTKKPYQSNHQQTYTLFTGCSNGYSFKVKQYEVYQIIGLS